MKYVNFHKFYITSFVTIWSPIFCRAFVKFAIIRYLNKINIAYPGYISSYLFHALSFGLEHETKTQTPKGVIFKLVGTGHSFRTSHR